MKHTNKLFLSLNQTAALTECANSENENTADISVYVPSADGSVCSGISVEYLECLEECCHGLFVALKLKGLSQLPRRKFAQQYFVSTVITQCRTDILSLTSLSLSLSLSHTHTHTHTHTVTDQHTVHRHTRHTILTLTPAAADDTHTLTTLHTQ